MRRDIGGQVVFSIKESRHNLELNTKSFAVSKKPKSNNLTMPEKRPKRITMPGMIYNVRKLLVVLVCCCELDFNPPGHFDLLGQ
jgi:hypothetical protein